MYLEVTTTFQYPVFKKWEHLEELSKYSLPDVDDSVSSDALVSLQDSVGRYGQKFPIFFLDGEIIDGRLRFNVMREMEFESAIFVDLGVNETLVVDVVQAIDKELTLNHELTVIQIAELIHVRESIIRPFVGNVKAHRTHFKFGETCRANGIKSIYDVMHSIGYNARATNMFASVASNLYTDIIDSVGTIADLRDGIYRLAEISRTCDHEIQWKVIKFVAFNGYNRDNLRVEIERLHTEKTHLAK